MNSFHDSWKLNTRCLNLPRTVYNSGFIQHSHSIWTQSRSNTDLPSTAHWTLGRSLARNLWSPGRCWSPPAWTSAPAPCRARTQSARVQKDISFIARYIGNLNPAPFTIILVSLPTPFMTQHPRVVRSLKLRQPPKHVDVCLFHHSTTKTTSYGSSLILFQHLSGKAWRMFLRFSVSILMLASWLWYRCSSAT